MSQFFSTENLKFFIQQNPDSLAFAHLGARLIDEGEYQGAIEVCQKGLEKHPDYSFGHFILGTAHYHVKNYTDAKKELEKALAYDPNNPRAWEILSAINEILNLGDDSQESNLQSYLIDFLNKDASSQYVFEIDAPTMSPQSDPQTELTQDLTPEKSSVQEVPAEQDLGEMLDDVLAGSEEEYDFDKALDDVFKDREEQATPDDQSTAEELSQIKEDATSEIVPSDKEDLVSAEEFTSAIESFFSDYEDEEKKTASPPEIPTEELPEINLPEIDQEKPTESMPFEEIDESEASPEEFTNMDEIPEEEKSSLTPEADSSVSEATAETSSPTSQADDEFLDFQSFVSDVIKDTEESSEYQDVDSNLEIIPDIPEHRITEEEAKKHPLNSFPEEEIEIPSENDFEKPLPPLDNLIESPAQEPEISDASSDESLEEKISPKFSKPPILSPTLGEIYIAQGRFEEAIAVFKQLLDKDPENSRFRRKINDLQNIVAKKKLGS